MQWAYGVTTVPERAKTSLPITLESLHKAGFDNPLICTDNSSLGAWGNWWLCLTTLYLQKPEYNTQYVIFQDDIVCVPNLLEVLEKSPDLIYGYRNLYTVPQNEELRPEGLVCGWYESNQMGRGALALMFSHTMVQILLSSLELIRKPLNCRYPKQRIDGAISDCCRNLDKATNEGFFEYVYYPSLVQHQENVDSTLENHGNPLYLKGHPRSNCFFNEPIV